MAKIDIVWEPFDVYAGRTWDRKFKLYKAGNKKALALEATDVMRFKLATAAGEDPLLDIDSVAPTVNGSRVTVGVLGVDETTPAEVTVRLAQADTVDLTPGEYFGELGLVDDSETLPANAFKRCGYGPVILKASPGGDVGLT